MKKNNFIITLTGPSQSGKSLTMNKIITLGDSEDLKKRFFHPEKIKKYTTRYLRLDELEKIQYGEEIDVQPVRKIPEECDLVYQTYGIRYGLNTEKLKEHLKKGVSPVVVINDIRAVEEIRKSFPNKVLSLFLFRKIPELEDFKEEAKDRGNVSEQEIFARYEKSVAIYRTYIENISLFDHVILNVIEYEPKELYGENTILNQQLRNVICPILDNSELLRGIEIREKLSQIFVISGNAASGKDEIIRALLSMGKLEAEIIPKYTMRQQEPADGKEMICRYIPKEEVLAYFREEYKKQIQKMKTLFKVIDEELRGEFLKQCVDFKQQLEEQMLNEFQRFWNFISEKSPKEESEILNTYFQINPDYVDLSEIKKNGKQEFSSGDVAVYCMKNHKYIVYGKDDRLYGCDVTKLQHSLEKNNRHFVIVASEIGVVNCLKYLYSDERIKFIYAHSEISAREFEEKALDTTKKMKIEKFSRMLEDYTKNISDYNHVTIYANSRLTYEQTSKEEELVDQMFRLLRAY